MKKKTQRRINFPMRKKIEEVDGEGRHRGVEFYWLSDI